MKHCVDCGHPMYFLGCPCNKMELLYVKDGKKYFKKECVNCHRNIYSKGSRGLIPRDYLDEYCNICFAKVRGIWEKEKEKKREKSGS